MEWAEAGYLGLFVATFLAATVIPFSSEAIFTGALVGELDPLMAIVVATAGNTLGGMTSFGLGWLGNWKRIESWLRVDMARIQRWKPSIDKYGAYTALICWTPIVGDVIAIALGIFKVNPFRTFGWMTIGKGLRYAVIAWVYWSW